MREFIITSDQMKMLAESVGYFVDKPISEVVIRGETLPDVGELLAENAKLRELVDYMTPIAWYAASERERDRMRELGVEVE